MEFIAFYLDATGCVFLYETIIWGTYILIGVYVPVGMIWCASKFWTGTISGREQVLGVVVWFLSAIEGVKKGSV